MINSWADLFVTTLRDPKAAAAFVMKSPLRREDLFAAIALCGAINTIAVSIFTLSIFPSLMEQMASASGQEVEALEIRSAPFLDFVLSSIMVYVFGFLIAHVGRTFAGTGEVAQVVTLFVWCQLFISLIQIVGFFLVGLSVTLGMLYFLAFLVLYFRTVLHFINTAHALESMGTAFFIWVIATVGVFIVSAIASVFMAGAA